MEKIGLGGGCHWCTEAVFQSLIGVQKVTQGYIASEEYKGVYSEGIILEFDPTLIPVKILIDIHLATHKSTSNHSMRPKYRSAIYVFSDTQREATEIVLEIIRNEYSEKIITEVLLFDELKVSRNEIQNYYYSNPEKPFCRMYIDPKIKILQTQFSSQLNKEKITHLLVANEESQT